MRPAFSFRVHDGGRGRWSRVASTAGFRDVRDDTLGVERRGQRAHVVQHVRQAR